MAQSMPIKGNLTRRQRMLVIGAGEVGAAILRSFQARTRQRWGEVPGLACMAVVGKGTSGATDGDLTSVQLDLDSGSVIGTRTRHALHVQTSEVLHTLLAKLADLSRLPGPSSRPAPDRAEGGELSSPRRHRRPLSAHLGVTGGHVPEMVIYLAAALDDLGGRILLELTCLARQLVHQHLHSVPVTMGLLLLPDSLALADPDPALARAYDTLREIDSARWDWSLAGGPDCVTVGPQPSSPFDGGCYLLGAVNAAGWRLARPEERIEFAAEVLVQLTLSPLSELVENVCSVWPVNQYGQNYASIGLASWVFPREAAARALAHRLATDVIEAWLADPAADADAESDHRTRSVWRHAEAAAFLAEHDLDFEAMSESLLPAGLVEETGVIRLAEPDISLSAVRHLRQCLEDDAVNRVEALAERRSAMDEAADAMGRRLAELVQADLAACLDLPEPGRLVAGEIHLTGIETYLGEQRRELEQVADIHWKALEQIDAEVDRVGRELEELADRFPEPTIRSLLRLAISPQRLVRLALTYVDLRRAVATYRSLWTHKMHTVLQVLRRDLVVRAYDGALEAVREQQARLAELQQTLCQARSVTDVDTGLFAPQGFEMEHSVAVEYTVLTPRVLAQLYEGIATSPEELLADFSDREGPLSRWLSDPPEGRVVWDTCLTFAWRRCRAVESLSITRLLLDQPGRVGTRQQILQTLESLSDAAVPFLTWDATQLTEEEREGLQVTTVLGTAEGLASPLLEDAGELPWSSVMATGDTTRITVVTVVRGLPLRAVAGLEEVSVQVE